MTFIKFTETHDTGKTKVWSIDNTQDGSHIGIIRWHGPWRKYVLLPANNTIWSPDCLQDTTTFITEQMALRRRRERT